MMVPQLKDDTVLAQDPSSVSNTPIRKLTIAYNSGSREFNSLFWPPPAPALTCTNMNTYCIIFKVYGGAT